MIRLSNCVFMEVEGVVVLYRYCGMTTQTISLAVNVIYYIVSLSTDTLWEKYNMKFIYCPTYFSCFLALRIKYKFSYSTK